MQGIRREKQLNRWLALGVALIVVFGSFGLALADSEIVADPPRVQQANGYTIEYLSPGNTGQHVGDKVTFRFRVTDTGGKPVDGLTLDLTAIRNYSGQVKKEHNGPRTPDQGPVLLESAGKPGEYQTTLRFDYNGHWNIKLGGASLNNATVQFRQPIEAQANTEAGVGLDWLIWPGLVLLVIIVVAVIRSGGEKFPVPTNELEPRLAQAEGGR